MKVIKISNGEVQIKEFCTRKLKKQINKALFEKVSLGGSDDGKSKMEGFSMEAMDKANDVALLGMVEKIIIGEEEKPVTIDSFDEMDSKDVDLIIDEINLITNKIVPNV